MRHNMDAYYWLAFGVSNIPGITGSGLFNGAATGTGGEIRDRLGESKASLPIAGTAVYMTSYPRTEENRSWENILDPHRWLYQSPEQILIKASNGAGRLLRAFRAAAIL